MLYYFHNCIHHNGLTQKILSSYYIILTILFLGKMCLYTMRIEIKVVSGSYLLPSVNFLSLKWLKQYRLVEKLRNSLRWCGNRKHEIMYYDINCALHAHPQKTVSPMSMYTGICTYLVHVYIKLVLPL